MSDSRQRLGACLGLGSAAWILGVTLLGGALRPGYSHVSQYISELGESGAAHGGWISLVGFAPVGALVLGFLLVAGPRLPAGRWRNPALVCLGGVVASYLVSSVARCEPGCSGSSAAQSLHDLSGLFEYAGALVGLRLFFYTFRRSERWREAALPSMLAAWAVTLGFIGMLTPSLAGARGLSQRIAEVAIFGWIAWVSLELLREKGKGA